MLCTVLQQNSPSLFLQRFLVQKIVFQTTFIPQVRGGPVCVMTVVCGETSVCVVVTGETSVCGSGGDW